MNNLQSFFKEEQNRASQLHHLLDGKITLYIRPKSVHWQVRITMPSGEYIRLSTGQYDLDEAKTQAVILYETIKTKIKMGTPVRAKTFGDVARLVLKDIRTSKTLNKHKKIYRDYVFVIQKYLLPFFDKKKIAELTAADIGEFDAFAKQPRFTNVLIVNMGFADEDVHQAQKQRHKQKRKQGDFRPIR
jgi:hypothetical protein